MADESSASGPGVVRAVTSVFAVAVALAYLSNIGEHPFELIPDAAPLMGNLDELAAALLLVWGVGGLFRKRAA